MKAAFFLDIYIYRNNHIENKKRGVTNSIKLNSYWHLATTHVSIVFPRRVMYIKLSVQLNFFDSFMACALFK